MSIVFETKGFDSSTSIAINSSAPHSAQAIRACGISGFPGLSWKRTSWFRITHEAAVSVLRLLEADRGIGITVSVIFWPPAPRLVAFNTQAQVASDRRDRYFRLDVFNVGLCRADGSCRHHSR